MFIVETNGGRKTTGTIAKKYSENESKVTKSKKINAQNEKKINDESQIENLTESRGKFLTIKEIFEDLEKKRDDREEKSKLLEYPKLEKKEFSNTENYGENRIQIKRKLEYEKVKVPEKKENWLQKLQKEKIKKKLEEKIMKENSTSKKQKSRKFLKV